MTTLSNLTAGTDVDGNTTATTASITLTANRLALLGVINWETFLSTTPATPTCSGWAQVATNLFDDNGAGRARLTVFRRMGGSNSTGTHTIDCGATNQAVLRWSIDETDADVDTGGTNGSGAVVQSATGASSASASVSATLAAFGSASNATYGCFGFVGDAGTTALDLTVGTGFTQLAEQVAGGNTFDAGLLTQYRTDNDTSVDATVNTTSIANGAIAIEIAAAPAGDPEGKLVGGKLTGGGLLIRGVLV